MKRIPDGACQLSCHSPKQSACSIWQIIMFKILHDGPTYQQYAFIGLVGSFQFWEDGATVQNWGLEIMVILRQLSEPDSSYSKYWCSPSDTSTPNSCAIVSSYGCLTRCRYRLSGNISSSRKAVPMMD